MNDARCGSHGRERDRERIKRTTAIHTQATHTHTLYRMCFVAHEKCCSRNVHFIISPQRAWFSNELWMFQCPIRNRRIIFRLFRHTNSDCDLPQYFRCYASGVVQRCVLVYGVTAAAVAVAAAARSCYVYFNSYKRKRNTQNCNEIKKSSFKSTHTQTQNNTIKYTIYFSAVNAARSVLAPHRRRQCTMHSIQYTQSETKIKRKQREKKQNYVHCVCVRANCCCLPLNAENTALALPRNRQWNIACRLANFCLWAPFCCVCSINLFKLISSVISMSGGCVKRVARGGQEEKSKRVTRLATSKCIVASLVRCTRLFSWTPKNLPPRIMPSSRALKFHCSPSVCVVPR